MSVKIGLRVGGVEAVPDGVLVMMIIDKPHMPVAENFASDEARVVKKMANTLQSMGFVLDPPPDCMMPNTPKAFRTGLWFTIEDYEKLGRPTVGDTLELAISIQKIEMVPVVETPKADIKGYDS